MSEKRMLYKRNNHIHAFVKVVCFLCMPLLTMEAFGQLRHSFANVVHGLEEYNNQGERNLKLDYGINLGGYLADNATAKYYNGSGLYSAVGNQGTVAQVLSSSNTFNYSRIRDVVGYDFSLDQLPMNMRYSPAMMLGLFASLQMSERIAVVAESNFSRLKAEDQFTIKLARFSSIEGDNIERYYIGGTEERIDIRLGLQYAFVSSHAYLHPFVEFGMILTDTKAKTNIIRIGGQTYSIYFSGTSQYLPERDYGLGLGGHVTLGLAMDVSEDFRFYLGYSSVYTKINLGSNDDFGLQHSIFIRLSLSNLFSAGR